MGTVVYESREEWRPGFTDTAVIACVDGRFWPHYRAFTQQCLQTDERVDIFGVPGGIEPLTLASLVPKDFNFLRRRLDALVEARGTRRIIAIGHEDCAWYRSRHFGPLTIDLTARQIVDLRRAGATLRELFKGVTIETYFARLSPGSPPRVVFERV